MPFISTTYSPNANFWHHAMLHWRPRQMSATGWTRCSHGICTQGNQMPSCPGLHLSHLWPESTSHFTYVVLCYPQKCLVSSSPPRMVSWNSFQYRPSQHPWHDHIHLLLSTLHTRHSLWLCVLGNRHGHQIFIRCRQKGILYLGKRINLLHVKESCQADTDKASPQQRWMATAQILRGRPTLSTNQKTGTVPVSSAPLTALLFATPSILMLPPSVLSRFICFHSSFLPGSNLACRYLQWTFLFYSAATWTKPSSKASKVNFSSYLNHLRSSMKRILISLVTSGKPISKYTVMSRSVCIGTGLWFPGLLSTTVTYSSQS